MDLGLLTTKEAADMLRLSESAVHKLRSEGQLPYVKLGRKVFYTKDSLAEYVTGRLRTNLNEGEVQ